MTPPHHNPWFIGFNDDQITVHNTTYDKAKNKTVDSAAPLKKLTGILVLKRDVKAKSRGIMIKAANLSLWNSGIKFWSCYKDEEGIFDCELLFNSSDPNWVVTHDTGVVKGNIKFYFPWFWERDISPNYLTNANRTLAKERGIKYLVIDASQNKGAQSTHVILL